MTANAADPKAPPDGSGDGQQDKALADRVDALETGQSSLADKLDQVIGILGGKEGGGHDGQPTGDGEPGAPTIAHEIRAQLDKRDREAAAAKADSDRNSTIAELQAKVAELTEQPPADVPTRRARLMGWT